MRRRACNRVREQMEAWEHSPPEWAQAHLRTCGACASAWRSEQQYRRALNTVRHEPVPVSQLRWEQVQAQLTARAIRQRTVRWRLALTGAFATAFAFFAMLGILLIYSVRNSAAPMQVAHLPNALKTDQGAPTVEKRTHNGSPAPLMRDSQQEPLSLHYFSSPSTGGTQREHPLFGSVSPMPNSKRQVEQSRGGADASLPSTLPPLARGATGGMGATAASRWEPEAGASQPSDDSLRLSFDWKAQQEANSTGEPMATVALAPLPDLRPEPSANIDYLPPRYGTEESHVCSF